MGAPGTGTSSTVLLWLLSRSAAPSFNPVWLHLEPQSENHWCTLLWRWECIWYNIQMSRSDLERFYRTRAGIHYFKQATVFVCDGITMKDTQPVFSACSALTADNVPLVFVSSQQVRLNYKKRDEDMDLLLRMPSWTINDYRNAVTQNPAVLDLFFKVLLEEATFTEEFGFAKSTNVSQEQIFSLIDRQYHYAGRSARWFFTVSPEGIMTRVGDALNRLPSLTNCASGDTGSLAPQFVNTLFQQNEDGKTSFVSSYVACTLAHKMEAKFLEMARNQYNLLNPSVNGFMFEYWVILHCVQNPFRWYQVCIGPTNDT